MSDMGECIIKDGCLVKYEGKNDVCVVVPEGVEQIGTGRYDDAIFDRGASVKAMILPKSVKRIAKSAFNIRDAWVVICLSEEYDFLSEFAEYYGGPSVFYTANPNAKEGEYRRAYNYSQGNVVRITPDDFVIKDGVLLAYLGTDSCLVVPDGVTSVASYAFVASPAVREVTLPSTVRKLESAAFYYAQSLEKIALPRGLSQISENCFRGCTALREMTVPDSVTCIENYAFDGCSAMERIALPAHLREVKSFVFSDCASLKSVSIPEAVESIGEYAFMRCKALTELSLPDSVRVLKRNSFFGCEALTEVSLGKVEEIERDAFAKNTALRRVRMSPALKQMDASVFAECPALEAVVIPDGLQHLTGAFFDKNATTLTLPDSVIAVEDGGFSGFPGVEEIHLPPHLQILGNNAFRGCGKLKAVHFGSASVILGEGVFSGAPSGLRVYFPGSADIWKKITEPKIEGRNKSYDSGSNGGAPGLSWDDYEVFPLGHPLEEDFTCEVVCADGETLICKGSISDRFIRSHSPYDD